MARAKFKEEINMLATSEFLEQEKLTWLETTLALYDIAYDCFFISKIIFVVDSSGVASVVYDQFLTLPLYFLSDNDSESDNAVN